MAEEPGFEIIGGVRLPVPLYGGGLRDGHQHMAMVSYPIDGCAACDTIKAYQAMLKRAQYEIVPKDSSGILEYTVEELLALLRECRSHITPTISTHEEITDILGWCDCGYCDAPSGPPPTP